jgi:hypothetical protein
MRLIFRLTMFVHQNNIFIRELENRNKIIIMIIIIMIIIIVMRLMIHTLMMGASTCLDSLREVLFTLMLLMEVFEDSVLTLPLLIRRVVELYWFWSGELLQSG